LRRTLLLFVALVAAGTLTAWFARAPLLRAAASWWIVSDPVEASDAVAVFGGGLESRPFAAASYYKQGLVKRVVLSDVAESPSEKLGIGLTHVAANRAVLLKLGVPESAIEIFGASLTNTYQEAVALRQWAASAGVHSIIVPTDLFSSRRLAWMLHRVFDDDTVIHVVALEPLGYNQTNWWHDEGGVIGFQNEIVKYAYYRVHY